MNNRFDWVIGRLRGELSHRQSVATGTDRSPGFAPFGEASLAERLRADAVAAEIEDAILILQAVHAKLDR